MSMKAPFSCLIILILTTMPLFAQGEPPSADQIVSKMQAALNLTQDQVSAIEPIIEKYASKRQELRQGVEDGTIERSDMRSQMKDLRVSEKKEVSQILSAEQLDQWEQMQKKMRKQWNQNQTSGNVSDDSSKHVGDNS